MKSLKKHSTKSTQWFIAILAVSIVLFIVLFISYFGIFSTTFGKQVDPAVYDSLKTIGVALTSLAGGIFIGEKIKK